MKRNNRYPQYFLATVIYIMVTAIILQNINSISIKYYTFAMLMFFLVSLVTGFTSLRLLKFAALAMIKGSTICLVLNLLATAHSISVPSPEAASTTTEQSIVYIIMALIGVAIHFALRKVK